MNCPKAAIKLWSGISARGLILNWVHPFIMHMTPRLTSQKRPSLHLAKGLMNIITCDGADLHHLVIVMIIMGIIRFYSVSRITTLVPDTEAHGCFSQQPSNGLFVSIKRSLLMEQNFAANDEVLFPYFAFANLVNPTGRLELVKETHPLYSPL